MYFFSRTTLSLAKKTWSFRKNLLFVQAHYSHWLIHNKREGERNHRAIKKEREKSGRVGGGKVFWLSYPGGSAFFGVAPWGAGGEKWTSTRHNQALCVCVCVCECCCPLILTEATVSHNIISVVNKNRG